MKASFERIMTVELARDLLWALELSIIYTKIDARHRHSKIKGEGK